MVASADLAAAAALPLSAYLLSGPVAHRIELAQDRLANTCMRRFDREAVHLAMGRRLAAADAALSFKERYGVTTQEDAARSGFRVTEPEDDGIRRLDQDDRFVYYGVRPSSRVPFAGMDGSAIRSPGEFRGVLVPPGGCLGQARQKLWGSPSAERKDDLARQLSLRAYSLSLKDGRLRGAFRRWSQCMAERGFDVSTPAAAQARAARSEMTDAEQHRTAAADVICKSQVSLLATWFSVLGQVERRLERENERALTAWRLTLVQADRRARAVLSDS